MWGYGLSRRKGTSRATRKRLFLLHMEKQLSWDKGSFSHSPVCPEVLPLCSTPSRQTQVVTKMHLSPEGCHLHTHLPSGCTIARDPLLIDKGKAGGACTLERVGRHWKEGWYEDGAGGQIARSPCFSRVSA